MQVLLLVSSCAVNSNLEKRLHVAPLSDTTRLKEGSVVYALPMTVFTFRVEAGRVINIPGPYSRFAGDLLGLKDVVTSREEHWSILSVQVRSHDEVDPSEYYVIESDISVETNVLSLKREGLILDINPRVGYQGIYYPHNWKQDPEDDNLTDLGSDEYFEVQTDTAFRRISIDTTYIRVPYIVEKIKTLPESELAARAARRLMDIREGKILILTGEANVFPQGRDALDEMNRMEREYMELFTGKTFRETITRYYQYIPRYENLRGRHELFRFSNRSGLLDPASGSGIPVTIELAPEQRTKDLTILTREPTDRSLPKTDKLFFRIPDKVSLNLRLGDDIIYNSRYLVYQLGEIIQLPSTYIIGK
jgi:hypothetical protein